jgi:TonB family protein
MKTVWASLTVSVLVMACGGNQPEPSKPSSPAPEASDGGGAAQSPDPTATAMATASASAPPPDAGAPSAPAAKPVVIAEAKDECTPVGVDFEKRARPKLKECYGEGKKKDPNLEGTVKVKVTVDVKGKIKSVKVVEKTLPEAVANCMLKVVKATPFPEVDKCWDSTLTIPITFPTPK